MCAHFGVLEPVYSTVVCSFDRLNSLKFYIVTPTNARNTNSQLRNSEAIFNESFGNPWKLYAKSMHIDSFLLQFVYVFEVLLCVKINKYNDANDE